MSVPSRCFLVLLVFPILYTGKLCVVADRFAAAVRWLSGQDYAQTHQLNQTALSPPPLRSHVSSRPLFSWDLVEETPTTTNKHLQLPTVNSTIHTSLCSETETKCGKEETAQRAVWWPWRNYKDWSRGRVKNNSLKQIRKNNLSRANNRPENNFIKTRKRKHKKIIKKKTNGKKQQNQKRNNKQKIPKIKIGEQKYCDQKISSKSTKYIYTNNINEKNLILLKTLNNELKTNKPNLDLEKTSKDRRDRNTNPYNNTFQLSTLHFEQSYGIMKTKLLSKDYISECQSAECQALCVKFLRSIICRCPQGFQVDSTKKKCLDINECSSRNGHGPCQGECTNTRGSYRCSCTNLTGTRLASDGHSCEDIDECNSVANSLVCSHGCINTVGTAFCFCPEGYELGSDWKTCQDVDECASIDLQTKNCAGVCVNTVGSYSCKDNFGA